jgi:hypothetical protein
MMHERQLFDEPLHEAHGEVQMAHMLTFVI